MTKIIGYGKVRLPALRGELAHRWQDAPLLARATEVADWLTRAEVIKQDANRSVLRLQPGGGLPELLGKFFPADSSLARLKLWLGADRPARIHRRLRKLASLDLPIPASLGHVSLASQGALWLSPIVTGKSLLHWSGPALPASREEQQHLIRLAIEVMVQLHRAGYAHGDFKWGNILYDTEAAQCWVVDVDALRSVPAARFEARRARDLARFFLDCEEAGLDERLVENLPLHYSALAELPIDEVHHKLQKPLAKLRARHRRRYGANYRLRPPDSDSSL